MENMSESTRAKVIRALAMVESAQDKRIKAVRLRINYVQQVANAVKRIDWQAGDYIECLLTKALLTA